MKALWILFLIFAIAFLIGSIPLKLKISASESGVNVRLGILFLSFAIGKKRKEKSPKKKQESCEPVPEEAHPKKEKKEKKMTLPMIMAMLKPAKKVARYLIKGVCIKNLSLSLYIATDDAAKTAILYGRVCSVAYPVLAFCKANLRLKVKRFYIAPDFYHERVTYQAKGMVSIRVYRILFGGLWYLGCVIKNMPSKAFRKKAAGQAA